MKKESITQIGGNIEAALKGQYVINPKNVLQEAWQKTSTTRWSINLGLLFVVGLTLVISFITSQYLGGIESIIKNPEAGLALNLLITITTWPFLAGVEMMGILHAVGIKTHPKLIFSFLRRGSLVALCAVMTSAFISLGLQLFVIPGVFLAVIFSLTIPLIVEKQLSPTKAIVLSFKALRFQLINILLVYLALMAVLFVAIMPLLLLGDTGNGVLIAGIIFTAIMSYLAPLYYNAKGILYREIFGMKLHTSPSDENTSNGSFIA